MAAVLIQTYTIDSALDLTDKTAIELEQHFKSYYDSTQDILREEMKASGETEGLDYYTEYNVTTRVMTRQRQFRDEAAAQKWMSHLETVIGGVLGEFTCIHREILADTEIPKRGRYIVN